ncbi:MAG: sirohydrochlorin cobaltochelatase [Eubacteriales bacterium]|nr:sirohydrochlorin cobaltochelatase [Eubacteriales bacterium]
MRDRELLAVSFGTSYQETREKTIGAIERRMADRFPDLDVRRCFTSRMIRRKLLERDGLRIEGPEEAIRRAAEKGIAELTVQPLYLMHGTGHRRLTEILQAYRADFTGIAVGKPLLTDERDFRILADAVLRHLPAADEKTAVVLMGHGTPVRRKNGEQKPEGRTEGDPPSETTGDFVKGIPAPGTAEDNEKGNPASGKTDDPAGLAEAALRDNAVFRILQQTFREKGAEHCFVATVEGELPPEKILSQIREQGFDRIVLAPFMIAAGGHALHDLAGEGEDSWKNLFLREGFEVETVLEGIGAWEEVQNLFADHAAEAELL